MSQNEIIDEIKEKLGKFDPEKVSVAELCKGEGTGVTAINDENRELFYPLLFAIEETIVDYYQNHTYLKDSDIIASLKKIRDNIFHKIGSFNELESRIINRLKIALLLNNYSRRDVSLAISCILKSVKLHKSINGKRGYLTFITEQFRQIKKGI